MKVGMSLIHELIASSVGRLHCRHFDNRPWLTKIILDIGFELGNSCKGSTRKPGTWPRNFADWTVWHENVGSNIANREWPWVGAPGVPPRPLSARTTGRLIVEFSVCDHARQDVSNVPLVHGCFFLRTGWRSGVLWLEKGCAVLNCKDPILMESVKLSTW